MGELRAAKDREERLKLIGQRIVRLKVALNAKKITVDQLNHVASLSAADIEQRVRSHPSHDKFFDLIYDLVVTQGSAIHDTSPKNSNDELSKAILAFDDIHGDYLSLLPLGTDNLETLAYHLSDFANLANLLIPHITALNPIKYELNEAKHSWLQWQTDRPERLALGSEGVLGIFEKFMKSSLGSHEWLSDPDIDRALPILGLDKFGVHRLPLKADDIGLALHFAREQADKNKSYTIPFILNLGRDDHNRIDSDGIHYVSMVVTIDPNSQTVVVKYHDPLSLSSSQKKNIEKTLTEALRYEERVGTYSVGGNVKQYRAFPDYKIATLDVVGSGQQKDPYSCGYRALQQIGIELDKQGESLNAALKEYLKLKSSESMRDYMYGKLLSSPSIPLATYSTLETSSFPGSRYLVQGANGYEVKPQVVQGLIYSFSSAQNFTRTVDDKKNIAMTTLEHLGEISALVTSLKNNQFIKNISSYDKELLDIDLGKMLADLSVEDKSTQEAYVRVIFYAIKHNPNIKKININNVDLLTEELKIIVRNEIDKSVVQTAIATSDLMLTEFISSVSARNEILSKYYSVIPEGVDLWDLLAQSVLYDIPINKSGALDYVTLVPDLSKDAVLKFGRIGAEKILSFLANNLADKTFPYNSLNVRSPSDLSSEHNFDFMIDVLINHLKSSNPILPFRKVDIKLYSIRSALPKLAELLILLSSQGVEKLYLSPDVQDRDLQELNTLIDVAVKHKITTQLMIGYGSELNTKFNNIVAENIREQNSIKPADTHLKSENQTESVVLGEIGQAMFAELGSLDSEVVNQEQQQIEQQMQSVSLEENLPDENLLEEKTYVLSTSDEEIIDRSTLRQSMGKFVENRSQDKSIEELWDCVVGKNSTYFKYGIKKMTISAAKQVFNNLKDCQYGLNPDNLPRGFYLASDSGGNIILSFDQFHPKKNIHESPLTVKFNQPSARSKWLGNIAQFLTDDRIQSLWKTHFEKINISIDSFRDSFFYIDSYRSDITAQARLSVIMAMVGSLSPELETNISSKINLLFGKDITIKNVIALGEVVYYEGPGRLGELLDLLASLKVTKGDEYFSSFKKVFVDTSDNLRDFLTEDALLAIKKIQSFSPEQMVWWQSLTEQHAKNTSLENEVGMDDFELIGPGRFTRWEKLSDLVEAFNYFCAQLHELNPSLTLITPCPFSNTSDMRVGLDRLLTILRNSSDLTEQFYQLSNLSLDSLGPFYASFYEGFKIVTGDMQLELGQMLNGDLSYEVISAEGLAFRASKDHVLPVLATIQSKDALLSYVLRYVATYNNRLPINTYKAIFNKIVNSSSDIDFVKSIISVVLLSIVGKQGINNASQNDIDIYVETVAKKYSSDEKDKNKWYSLTLAVVNHSILLLLSSNPVKPSLSEITTIMDYMPIPDSDNILTTIVTLYGSCGIHANVFMKGVVSTIEYEPEKLVTLLKYLSKNENTIKKYCDDNDIDSALFIANTMRVLSIAKGSDYVNIEKTLMAFGAKFGNDTLQLLFGIISRIDLDKSTERPNINDIIMAITSLTPIDYVSASIILDELKKVIPEGVVFGEGDIFVVPESKRGDLSTIIASQLENIKTELLADPLIAFVPGLPEFISQLDGIDGAMLLLNKLDMLTTTEIPESVTARIIKVMRSVYDTAKSDGLSQFSNVVVYQNLTKIFGELVQHPIMRPSGLSFSEFLSDYPSELQGLNDAIDSFKSINAKWPNQIIEITGVIVRSAAVNYYSVGLLNEILTSFNKNFSANKPFPLNVFQAFFDARYANNEPKNELREVLFRTLPKDESQYSFTEDEKSYLPKIALQCLRNKESIEGCVEELISIKNVHADIFLSVLELLSKDTSISYTSIRELKNFLDQTAGFRPEVKRSIIEFYQSHPSDIGLFIKDISSIDNSQPIEDIISIAFKSAKVGGYSSTNMSQVIELLKSQSTDDVKRLSTLYSLPNYPSMDYLITINTNKIDIAALEYRFDVDPGGHRSNPDTGRSLLDQQFSINDLNRQINDLKDLKHNRPLLRSQRQTLLTYYMYIHAIGRDLPIMTNPNNPAEGVFKPIKDMTRTEILSYIKYCREILKEQGEDDKNEKHIKAKLEYIAICREVMYRTTQNNNAIKPEPGSFAYPVQILELLVAMMSGPKHISQMQTGEGKSLTAALAAALLNLDDRTVDVCTQNIFQASEGLHDNNAFFEYLNIKTHLITSESKNDDYTIGGIHYSSASELALYRSKMELEGKVFDIRAAILGDEIDFSLLDDTTHYRYAVALDKTSNPYVSPYIWIYEYLITFVDDQVKLGHTLSDAQYIKLAQEYLLHTPQGNSEALKNLMSDPEVFQKRLKTWLIAAAKTTKLVDMEEQKYRIETLAQTQNGVDVQVSKACLLMNGRPNIQAELSDAVQQFLHVRLRQKYKNEITSGRMPDFRVEPEKSYLTSLSSKILFQTYEIIHGLTGTAGSTQEINELFEKYGVNVIEVPPNRGSQRQDLAPILTDPKYVGRPDEEDANHTSLIQKESMRHIGRNKFSEPILITGKSKEKNQAISEKHKLALQGTATQVREYYGSSKPTVEERNVEERLAKNYAGRDGTITISSVFERGTDIKLSDQTGVEKLRHVVREGLYQLGVDVDTAPNSTEDLERFKRQRQGRAGRQGLPGKTRLILKRSEFSPIYTESQLKSLPATTEAVNEAIRLLNAFRNKSRVIDRELHEIAEDVKKIFYNQFLKINSQLLSLTNEFPSASMLRTDLLVQWNDYLKQVDANWSSMAAKPDFKQNPQKVLRDAVTFADDLWNKDFLKKTGDRLDEWMKLESISSAAQPVELPELTGANDIITALGKRHPKVRTFYVKSSEQEDVELGTITSESAYCHFAKLNPVEVNQANGAPNLANIRLEDAKKRLEAIYNHLRTPAHKAKLRHLNLCATPYNPNQYADKAKEAASAYLYLLYKSYVHYNPVAGANLYSSLSDMVKLAGYTQDKDLLNAIKQAITEHYYVIASNHGDNEEIKEYYLRNILPRFNHILPKETLRELKSDLSKLWQTNSGAMSRKDLLETTLLDLTAYKNKWWTRSWVSEDRKNQVNQLMNDIQMSRRADGTIDFSLIMSAITKTQAALVKKDLKDGKPMQLAIDSRLYKQLQDIQARLFIPLEGAELDKLVQYKLESIKMMLDQFSQQLDPKKHRDLIADINNVVVKFDSKKFDNNDDPEFQTNVREYYQMLLSLFAKVESLAVDKASIKDETLRSLFAYSKDQRLDLVNYFSVCDQLSAINHDSKIEVFKAISAAASKVVRSVADKKLSKNNDVITEVLYGDKTVACKVSSDIPVAITKSSFYKQITHSKTLQSLLSQIEESIVERRSTKTEIDFTELNVSSSGQIDDRFKMTINFKVNNEDSQGTLYFNTKSKTVYVDFNQVKIPDLKIQLPDSPGTLLPLPNLSQFFGKTASQAAKAEGVHNKVQGIKEKMEAGKSQSKEISDLNKEGSEPKKLDIDSLPDDNLGSTKLNK